MSWSSKLEMKYARGESVELIKIVNDIEIGKEVNLDCYFKMNCSWKAKTLNNARYSISFQW